MSDNIESLLPGSQRIIDVCAAVQRGEEVVIVTDTDRDPVIAFALSQAAHASGGTATILVTEPIPSGSEPPATVAAALNAANVIFAPTSGALFHTSAVQLASKNGARFLGLTMYTPDVLQHGGIFADFPAFAPKAERLAVLLSDATRARVTTEAGTDISVRLDGRTAVPITGMARQPGERTGCPDIEAFIAPIEGTAEGVVVVDASASIAGVLDDPITVTIEQGRAVTIVGGSQIGQIAEALENAGIPEVFVLAELAFGLNPEGIIRGVIVEDEGVAGTGHIALGSNIHFGGANNAPLHLDFVFRQPRLWLDDHEVDLTSL